MQRLEDKEALGALVHLYRAEVGLMGAYRIRLDTTTNWAVATTAALVSFSLGNSSVPHLMFLLLAYLNFVFLWMEARRYRHYAMARDRVRLLERGLYREVLGCEDTGWRQALDVELARPVSRMPLLHSLVIRIRRNYIWIFATTYVAWLLKLELHGDGPLVTSAHVGPFPGPLVFALTTLCFMALVVLLLRYPIRESAEGEEIDAEHPEA